MLEHKRPANISGSVVAMYRPAQPNWYLDPLVAVQKRDVHLQWIARNIPAGSRIRTVLKTDLFEEAYGEDQLLFSLPFDADLKAGIDIDAGTVARAARRDRARSNRFVQADVRRLPLRDCCVDVVLSNSTLDHFSAEQEIEDSLRELTRVLRPGGTLLVTLDNLRNPLYLVFRAAAGRLGLSFSLGKTLPLRRLLSILERQGLEIQSNDWLIHNPRFVSTLLFLALRRTLGTRAERAIGWLLAAFSKLDRLPTRSFTGAFVAACARKPGGNVCQSGLPATGSQVSGNMKFSPRTCSVSKQPVNRMESAW
jgi:SAM-dependent methyltransferase